MPVGRTRIHRFGILEAFVTHFPKPLVGNYLWINEAIAKRDFPRIVKKFET
jgi:hypothetical protein